MNLNFNLNKISLFDKSSFVYLLYINLDMDIYKYSKLIYICYNCRRIMYVL